MNGHESPSKQPLHRDTPAPARSSPPPIPGLEDPSSASTSPLEDLVLRALAVQPLVAVPEHFAARVAARAVADGRPHARPWLGWGPRLSVGSAALLTVGMFLLAPHAVVSFRNVAFDSELLLLAELGTLLLFAGHLLPRD